MSDQSLSICVLCGTDAPTESILGRSVCGECKARIEVYDDRVKARYGRMRERAEKIATAGRKDDEVAREMAQAIPLGQPILVGHHSEKRDRRYRDRIERRFRRAFEQMDEAKKFRSRADAAESNTSIRTDDPAARIKLADKLAELERLQEYMVRVNAIVRKAMKLTPEQRVEYLSTQAKITTEKATRLLQEDFAGCTGYPDYSLKNNGAEIRRLKGRIRDLEARAKVAETSPVVERIVGSVRIEENAEDNRLRLRFNGKPPADIIASLKSRGFRWTPSMMAWQKNLSNAARYDAEVIAQAYNTCIGNNP